MSRKRIGTVISEPSYAYCDGIIECINIDFSYKGTLEDQNNALKNLLQNKLRECNQCGGVGIGTFTLLPCWHCQSSGLICAWCSWGEHICECGTEL